MSKARRGTININDVIEKLKAGRNGALQVAHGSKINGPEYKAADAIVSAIDDLAEIMAGDREAFQSYAGHGPGGWYDG